MPLYEYHDAHHGVSVDLYLPAGRAPDEIVLRRVRIPRSIHCLTRSGQTEDGSVGQRIAEGYRHLERQGKLARKGSGHLTARQIKQGLAL